MGMEEKLIFRSFPKVQKKDSDRLNFLWPQAWSLKPIPEVYRVGEINLEKI
jgi:hypothetical protein